MFSRLNPYLKLTRFDKPIGSLLLLWPTYWALLLTKQPSLKLFIIFTLGVLLMRSAGCVINDLADQRFDGKVKRTANRPLVNGTITRKKAWITFFVLVFCAACLLFFLPLSAFYFSLGAIFLTCTYPFMKRITHFPQLILGLAFSFGIPMVYASTLNEYPFTCWLLFAINVCWTIGYDTAYAMVDRDDDIQIGVKSTAVFFGRFDRWAIGLLQIITFLLLLLLAQIEALGFPFFLALFMVVLLFIYQQTLIATRDRTRCFKAFLNNNYVGAVIFIGLAMSYPYFA